MEKQALEKQIMEKQIVSLQACRTYDQAEVDAAVARLLAPLGGMAAFVRPGQRVLVKPNLVMRMAPERAGTTHPAVMRALVKEVQAAGGVAIIGDSPGGPINAALQRSLYQGTGMAAVAEETGAELLTDMSETELAAPHGRVAHRFPCLQARLDADVLISVGKLKTHGLTTMTGAAKNLFGLLPGTTKMEYHALYPDVERFCGMLVDLVEVAGADLAITDAIIGMEGEGPTGGQPRAIGALIASPSPFAADAVGAQLLGLEPGEVMMLAEARQRGLLGEVDVIGESVDALRVADFAIPMRGETKGGFTSWLSKRAPFIRPRPVFPHKACNGCGICAASCPVAAITMNEQKRPQVNYKPCIRCFCCQELCPKHDVVVKRHPLMRFLR